MEMLTLDTGTGGQTGQLFKGSNKLRSTIRVPRIINCVYTYENGIRLQYLCPTQSKGEKNRIAGRHIGDRDTFRWLTRYFDGMISKRRTPNLTQIDANHAVLLCAKSFCYLLGCK